MIKKNGHTLPVTGKFLKTTGRQPLEDNGASPLNLANLLRQPVDSAKKRLRSQWKGYPQIKHLTLIYPFFEKSQLYNSRKVLQLRRFGKTNALRCSNNSNYVGIGFARLFNQREEKKNSQQTKKLGRRMDTQPDK